MTEKRLALDWKEWLTLGLVSGLGAFMVGASLPLSIVALYVLASSPMATTAHALALFSPVALSALIVPSVQWLVLRKARPGLGWWILASVAGALTGFLAISALWLDGIALVGGALGLGQWVVLRRRVLRAGWWVLSAAVGAAVAIALTPWIYGDLADALLF